MSRSNDASTAKLRPRGESAARVCVVGSGTQFLSGISYYTRHLAAALAERGPVSVVLMRRLIPRALYPGRERVGKALTGMTYPSSVPVFDGVDWFWVPSLFRAVAFLWRQRPTHIVFEWWTGAVLHSFLVLAAAGRLLGSTIIVEFHEVQDPGESVLRLARWYVRGFAGLLMRMASGFVVHSEFDRPQLERHYPLAGRPVSVILHGPYDHHDVGSAYPRREAPASACNFFFFGTIRPYKGLEDLVRAFELICSEAPDDYWLTVVGETWEDWTLPIQLIEASPYRDQITFVNRYVTDDEVAGWFAGADVVVLPYRRSSASGPLHLAMSTGLPTVVTAVGGLPEAAEGYDGAIFSDAGDPHALLRAMCSAATFRGRRFADPHTWTRTADDLLRLADQLRVPTR